jgi:hypothetical protein
MTQERTKMGTVFCFLTVTLLIASLSSVWIIQNNKAIAATNAIFKEKFRDSFAFAQKRITEGSITTFVNAEAFKDISGNVGVFVAVVKTDESTGTDLTDYFGSGPGQLTVGSGLSSATFSATVTGTDFLSGEDKTVTVNSQLSATGKVQTSTFGFHANAREFTEVVNSNGMIRPASGSLTVSGDITFSTNDATGTIGNAKQGSITVLKN